MGRAKIHTKTEQPAPGAYWFRRLLSSIWLFPVLVTFIFLMLVALKLNGSSIGAYDTYFYGEDHKDTHLLAGVPRGIRTDEWTTNTPLIIAQTNNNFVRVNDNIAQGQDMSVVVDVPYKGWSQTLRPQNWSFFILPFDFAFAFKWWLLAYLLVLSCYFFVLAILPGRRLLAAGLSICLLLGALVQWWYQFVTLAPLYYSLFAATAFVKLLQSKKTGATILWGALLSYILACFALVLYPPFQVACGVVLGVFMASYLLHSLRTKSLVNWKKIGIITSALIVAGSLAALFVFTRSNVVDAINNTVYPGKRVVTSGDFDIVHTFAGHDGFDFQFLGKANQYRLGSGAPFNQSEASNFILLLPFLLLPSLYFIYSDARQRKKPDWMLIGSVACFLLFLGWLFVPGLSLIGKLTLLDKVPMTRLLIGLGLLNIMQIVFIIRRLQNTDLPLLRNKVLLATYATLVFGWELLVSLWIWHRSPGFMPLPLAIACSIPVAFVVYWLLRRRFTLAVIGLAAFSFFTAGAVNPLYRGTHILTETPLSKAIQDISQSDDSAWVTDVAPLENFPAMNGARTYSGVYTYPQPAVWEMISNSNDTDIYNRFAHVSFNFDRDTNVQIPTSLNLTGVDHYEVITEPCSQYMSNENIRYILTDRPIDDSCAQLIQMVTYPAHDFLIYKINER